MPGFDRNAAQRRNGHMAKVLNVTLSGDPRNPSGPCISHAFNNYRSFFKDTIVFYGETDSGVHVELEVKVSELRWLEKTGSWQEIKGVTADSSSSYVAQLETDKKIGSIRCTSLAKASYAEA